MARNLPVAAFTGRAALSHLFVSRCFLSQMCRGLRRRILSLSTTFGCKSHIGNKLNSYRGASESTIISLEWIAEQKVNTRRMEPESYRENDLNQVGANEKIVTNRLHWFPSTYNGLP